MSAPVWTLTRSGWQAARGIHEPYIAEISPMQLAHMSKAAKRRYEAQRSKEWEASAEAGAEYRRLVVDAFARGEFAWDDASNDAKDAVRSHQARVRESDNKALTDAALKANRLSIADLVVGERVFDIMSRSYGTVVKVSRKSARVKLESGYQPGREAKVYDGMVRRLSHDDAMAAIEVVR